MNEHGQDSATGAARWRRRASVAGLVLVALALGAWLMLRPTAPPVEPTLGLADVVRGDGRLVLRTATNQVFTGWLVEKQADGTLKSRSRVLAGLLHGVSEGWYTNGRIQVREHFVGGRAEGTRVKWHANGATQSVAVIVQGQLHGRFLRWHEDGTLSEEVMMEKGQPDGVSRAYYPSGFVKAEARLKAGQVLEQRFWKDGETPPGAGVSSAAPVTTRHGS